jgi:hypothetical protein
MIGRCGSHPFPGATSLWTMDPALWPEAISKSLQTLTQRRHVMARRDVVIGNVSAAGPGEFPEALHSPRRFREFLSARLSLQEPHPWPLRESRRTTGIPGEQ